MEAAILFVVGCIVVYIGFRLFRFYENNRVKIEKIGIVVTFSIIFLVFAIWLYQELPYLKQQAVLDFLSGLFWLAFWAISLVVAFFILKKYLASKKQKEQHYQHQLKILNQQNIVDNQRINESKAREQEYQRNLKHLECIQNQNQKMREEISNLKPMVSELSIYNDDFLEIQPVLLEYIETAIKTGKI
jgi:uncharacterized membrane protein